MVCRNFVYILWSVPSSPKNIATQGSHIVWGIGVQVVCVDFIHSSWRQEGRDAIVYTNLEKDRHISISSSPKKHCDTMIACCVRNCCAVGVCRFCAQVMATGERCDCLHKIRKGQTDLNLILSKKYCDTRIAYCVRNRCAGGVYGFCTQLMATGGERCDCLHKFRKGQTDLNIILSKKYCDTRIT